jgi:conjugal transfer pilus assembly protein TraE
MNFKIASSKMETLRAKSNLLTTLCAGLLVSNMLLGILSFSAFHHSEIRYIPMTSSPFTLSSAEVDSVYLDAVSLSILSLKLNVTPKTVEASHQHLLSYVVPYHYSEFSKTLSHEKDVIIEDDMSSSFYLESIHSNPNDLTSVVTGSLHRFVGARSIEPAKVNYRLRYEYQNGRIQLKSFEGME